MADRQQSTTFPAPPPFYKHFTRQNLDLHRSRESGQLEIKSDFENDDTPDGAQTRALQYLTPPIPPKDGKWRGFGIEHELDAAEASLEESGVEQLFPDHPSVKLAPQAYLLTMARSLLSTFLATTAVLAQNPALYTKKVEDLRTIAVNMHYLINQYRPHQARETLIDLMERRMENLQSEIDAINGAKSQLAALAKQLQDSKYIQEEDELMTEHAVGQDTHEKPIAADLSELWDILNSLPAQENEKEAQAIEDT